MNVMKLAGLILTLIGIALVVMKWAFGIEAIGYWSLAALVPGVGFSWLADQRMKKTSNG